MDWVRILEVVLSAGVIVAIFKGIGHLKTIWQKAKRENREDTRIERSDEIQVLYRTITGLEGRILCLETALSDNRTAHTACLLEQERLRGIERQLTGRNEDLVNRVTYLEGLAGVKSSKSKVEINVENPNG